MLVISQQVMQIGVHASDLLNIKGRLLLGSWLNKQVLKSEGRLIYRLDWRHQQRRLLQRDVRLWLCGLLLGKKGIRKVGGQITILINLFLAFHRILAHLFNLFAIFNWLISRRGKLFSLKVVFKRCDLSHSRDYRIYRGGIARANGVVVCGTQCEFIHLLWVYIVVVVLEGYLRFNR